MLLAVHLGLQLPVLFRSQLPCLSVGLFACFCWLKVDCFGKVSTNQFYNKLCPFEPWSCRGCPVCLHPCKPAVADLFFHLPFPTDLVFLDEVCSIIQIVNVLRSTTGLILAPEFRCLVTSAVVGREGQSPRRCFPTCSTWLCSSRPRILAVSAVLVRFPLELPRRP